FAEPEKLGLRLAVAMSQTPADVPDELFAALRRHFDDAQLVELGALIAWENFRSRFNRLFDVGAQGFSAGRRRPSLADAGGLTLTPRGGAGGGRPRRSARALQGRCPGSPAKRPRRSAARRPCA